MLPYKVLENTAPEVPIIISIPHCGTDFPNELKDHYLDHQLNDLDDTDWFLDRLNEFAPAMGITVVHAHYHRWVIDLNRNPDSKPLYNDGRVITGLCSTTDFLGKPIYKSGMEPNEIEIKRRLEQYYWPYYEKVQRLINDRISKFGKVLLWDEHSIRSFVPTIRETKFPEMILGNNDEQSADKKLINCTLNNLSAKYQVNHNNPFKGGHITRYFGNPDQHIHALQLERNKDLYMDETERFYAPDKAEMMQNVLKHNFNELIEVLQTI